MKEGGGKGGNRNGRDQTLNSETDFQDHNFLQDLLELQLSKNNI